GPDPSRRRSRCAAGGFHGAHHGPATRHSRRDRVRHESHRRRVSRFEPWTAQDRERDRRRHRRLLARARAQARRRSAGEESVTLPPIRLFGVSFQNPGSEDRKSTRLNSSHRTISYAVFCLKKKKKKK